MIVESIALHGRQTLHGHGHHDFHICIVQGGGFIERDGNGWQECGPGVARVSPAHAEHELLLDDSGLHCTIVELPAMSVRGLTQTLDHSRFLPSVICGDRVGRFGAHWANGDQFAAECLALELAAYSVLPVSSTTPPRWVEDLRAELSSNSDRLYSLADAARRFDLHRSHVARTFRAWYGRSAGAHVRAHRAYAGADRLRTSQQPIADLALELGFVDQAHFTRVFRAHLGVSPGRYRRIQACERVTQLSYKTARPAGRIHS